MHRPLPDVLAKLSKDHLDFRQVLNILDRQMEEIAHLRSPNMDALSDAIKYLASFPVRYHHDIEEKIYALLQQSAPNIANKVTDVQDQHREGSERLAHFSNAVREIEANVQVSRKSFCDAARDYIGFERDHIRDEGSYFFHAALEHLTPDDWEDIDFSTRAAESERTHLDTAARYRRLRERIMTY